MGVTIHKQEVRVYIFVREETRIYECIALIGMYIVMTQSAGYSTMRFTYASPYMIIVWAYISHLYNSDV